MPFEEFRQKGGRARFGYAAVTILRSGGMSMNKVAYEELASPTHIVLAYDKDEKLIGIRAGTREEPHAYQVRPVSEDSYWIAAQGFLKFYGLTATEATARHKAVMADKFLAVDMKAKPIQTERRKSTEARTEAKE